MSDDPGRPVTVNRIVPNLFDDHPRATVDFYTGIFELDVGMDAGWITTLVAPANRLAQLSVFESDAEPGRKPFASIEVSDVDAVHRRALELGHEVVYALRDEPWGVRRFMLRDPAGRIVNVLMHPAT